MNEVAERVPGIGRANRRSALRLSVVVVAMFGFGYLLVPFYDLLCDITGLDGRTGVVRANDLEGGPDLSRTVSVQFLSTVNSRLPWVFEPTTTSLQVHPGGVYDVTYVARNNARVAIVGQAVPNVAPNEAAPYFNKIECFCFTEQRIEPGQEKEMPVRFVVSRDLPPHLRNLTLSYTFFRAGQSS